MGWRLAFCFCFVGVLDALSVDECMKAIQDNAWFAMRTFRGTGTINQQTMEFSHERA
jgi:hypothetical protein